MSSAAVTGTATETINEDDVVAGGKDIIATLTDDTYVPLVSTALIAHVTTVLQSSVAFTTSFTVVLPTTQANDVMALEFVHRSTTDGGLYGTGGSGWALKHSQLFSASAFSGKLYWKRATGDHASEIVRVSSLINSCAGMVSVYRNVAAAVDPFLSATIVGEQNASGDETQAQISTTVAGTMVALTVVNSPDLAVATQSTVRLGPLTERGERLNTGGTDCSIAHASALFSANGSTNAFTWTQTNAASGSWAYALTPVTTAPFDAARQAFIDGIDSGQSEANGWDAVVKAGQDVSTVVRTSDTEVTMTLSPWANYNITAQETITVSVPGGILSSGTPILASPTFTVDIAGGAPAVNRIRFPMQTSGMGVGGMLGGNRVEFARLFRLCLS